MAVNFAERGHFVSGVHSLVAAHGPGTNPTFILMPATLIKPHGFKTKAKA